jgi:hypothetical protein
MGSESNNKLQENQRAHSSLINSYTSWTPEKWFILTSLPKKPLHKWEVKVIIGYHKKIRGLILPSLTVIYTIKYIIHIL